MALNDTSNPQDPSKQPPARTRRHALHELWNKAWADDGTGVLHNRWEDLRSAPGLGWHGMAHWVKTALGLAGICVVLILLNGAADALAQALHQLLTAMPRVQVGADTSTGIWTVIDQPIRSYIAQHSASLAISGSTVYTLWQLAGLFGLIAGFFRSSGARLLWTLWGAFSVAAVFSATPAGGRTIATGIAALAWGLGSVAALRGLSLRPSVFIHNAIPQTRPEIHVPAADDAPDNVRPLPKR